MGKGGENNSNVKKMSGNSFATELESMLDMSLEALEQSDAKFQSEVSEQHSTSSPAVEAVAKTFKDIVTEHPQVPARTWKQFFTNLFTKTPPALSKDVEKGVRETAENLAVDAVAEFTSSRGNTDFIDNGDDPIFLDDTDEQQLSEIDNAAKKITRQDRDTRPISTSEYLSAAASDERATLIDEAMERTEPAAQRYVRVSYEKTIGNLRNAPKPADIAHSLARLGRDVNDALWHRETIKQQRESLVDMALQVKATPGASIDENAGKEFRDSLKQMQPAALEGAIVEVLDSKKGMEKGTVHPSVMLMSEALKGHRAGSTFVKGFRAAVQAGDADRVTGYLAAASENGIQLSRSAKAQLVMDSVNIGAAGYQARDLIVGAYSQDLSTNAANQAFSTALKQQDFENAAKLAHNQNLSRSTIVAAIRTLENTPDLNETMDEYQILHNLAVAQKEKLSNADFNVSGLNGGVVGKAIKGLEMQRDGIGRMKQTARDNIRGAAQDVQDFADKVQRKVSEAIPDPKQVRAFASSCGQFLKAHLPIQKTLNGLAIVGGVLASPVLGVGAGMYAVGKGVYEGGKKVGEAIGKVQESVKAARRDAGIKKTHDSVGISDFNKNFERIFDQHKNNPKLLNKELQTLFNATNIQYQQLSQKVADKTMMPALQKGDLTLATAIANRAQRMSPSVVEQALKTAMERPNVAGARDLFGAMSDKRYLDAIPASKLAQTIANNVRGTITGRIFRAPEWLDKFAAFMENAPTAAKRSVMQNPTIRDIVGYAKTDTSKMQDASVFERKSYNVQHAKETGNKIRESLSPAGRTSADRLFATAARSGDVEGMVSLISNPKTRSQLTAETVTKGIAGILKDNERHRDAVRAEHGRDIAGKRIKETNTQAADRVMSAVLPALQVHSPAMHKQVMQDTTIHAHVDTMKGREQISQKGQALRHGLEEGKKNLENRVQKQEMRGALHDEIKGHKEIKAEIREQSSPLKSSFGSTRNYGTMQPVDGSPKEREEQQRPINRAKQGTRVSYGTAQPTQDIPQLNLRDDGHSHSASERSKKAEQRRQEAETKKSK